MDHIVIENRFIDQIEWKSGDLCLFEPVNNIHVWQTNTTAFKFVLTQLYSLLNKREINKSIKFYFDKDKSSYIVSHAVLRLLLGKYLQQSPFLLNFEYSAGGKPFLADKPNLHFNISHSGEYTLIAIAASYVGADIERVNNCFDFNSILTDNFSQNEKDYVTAGGPHSFFKLWTRKEALAKITGKGLNDDLPLLPANDGLNVASSIVVPATGNLLVNSFKLNNDYYCSIAGKANIGQLFFYDFNLAFYEIIVADVFPR